MGFKRFPIALAALRLTAGDFVNLTFDDPDLTGSLIPIWSEAPQGPFFGEASRLLRGWTITGNGSPVTTVTYSPWPTSALERTIHLQCYRPEEAAGLGGANHLYVYSGGNPLGPAFRLSQTATIPADATGLHLFAPRLRDMRINGEPVTDPLLGFLADPIIDVSRYAGQEAHIEFRFGPGFSGNFDIFGFTQVPEPSTWTLFGVGATGLFLVCRHRRLAGRGPTAVIKTSLARGKDS